MRYQSRGGPAGPLSISPKILHTAPFRGNGIAIALERPTPIFLVDQRTLLPDSLHQSLLPTTQACAPIPRPLSNLRIGISRLDNRAMRPFVYDHAQITDWLGAHTVAKARPYCHSVSHVSWTDNTLNGRVQGTERRPYQVQVQFEQDDDELVVDGECSCPVGYDCKHVAALLIAGLELVPKTPAPVRPELVQWLEAFRTRHSTSVRKSSTTKATVALAYVIGPSYRGPEVTLYKARLKPDGTIRILDEPWNNVEAALVKPMKFLCEEDLTLLRRLWFGRAREDYGGLVLRGTAGARPRLCQSGDSRLGSPAGAARGCPASWGTRMAGAGIAASALCAQHRSALDATHRHGPFLVRR